MRMTNRSTSRRGATWAAFVMGVLLGAGPASATVPTVINYQGRLTDNTAQQNVIATIIQAYHDPANQMWEHAIEQAVQEANAELAANLPPLKS